MRKNVPADLWKSVEIGEPNECWPWRGNASRYGVISINGKNRSTHRVAYDAVRKGRRPDVRGSRHPGAKLTEQDVVVIRSRRGAGERGRVLAAEFGVAPSTITRIVKHADRDWSHV